MGAAHHELAKAARVPVDRIRVHPRNIRSKLTRIESLSRSIRAEGVLQPLVVHRKFRRGTGVQDLELIAGHRRLAAAELAGLSHVPCIVLPQMRDDEAILAMLAENAQRRAVPAMDIARAITALRTEFGYADGAIAERLGISLEEVRSWSRGHAADTEAGADDPVAPRPGTPARPRATKAPNVHRQAVTTPKITARRIHDLLGEHDRGDLTADQVVARLRGALGGWEPPPRGRQAGTSPGVISEKEPDDAEVEQILNGTRRGSDAHPSTIRAAVRKLDDGTRSAAEIAVRLGISQRNVVRHREKAS